MPNTKNTTAFVRSLKVTKKNPIKTFSGATMVCYDYRDISWTCTRHNSRTRMWRVNSTKTTIKKVRQWYVNPSDLNDTKHWDCTSYNTRKSKDYQTSKQLRYHINRLAKNTGELTVELYWRAGKYPRFKK